MCEFDFRQAQGVDHSAAAATQAHVVRGNAGFDVDVWRGLVMTVDIDALTVRYK